MISRRFGTALSAAAAPVVLLALLVPATQALDERDRDARLQPDRVMDAIGVRPGWVIGEAGAGRGYFTVKLARRVGASGKVYANDIDTGALEHLRERARREGLGNIETIVGEVADPLFPERALDLAIFVYALHDFAEPVAFLRNLKHSLKPGANVVILDQNPDAEGRNGHFLPRARLVEIFRQAGYELAREETFLAKDLLLLFRPAP